MRVFTSTRRARSAAAMLVAAVVLAVPAMAGATTGGFTTTLKVPTHKPKLGQTWIATGTATKGAAKLSGHVRYLMILLGLTEHTDPWKPFKDGHFAETLNFPKTGVATLAVGLKMTFSLQVKTKYGTKTINEVLVEQK